MRTLIRGVLGLAFLVTTTGSSLAMCDPAGVDAAFAQAVDDTLDEFRRRGQALGLDEGLRLVIEPDQVGECAADIDRHKDHATAPTLVALVFRRWSWWVNCACIRRGGIGPADHIRNPGAAQCQQIFGQPVFARSSTRP